MPKESIDFTSKISEVKDFLTLGSFEEALAIIEALENAEQLNETEKLSGLIFRSQIHTKMGNYKASLELAERAWKESQGRALQGVDACIAKAEALWRFGRYDESLQAISEGETLLSTLKDADQSALEQRNALFAHHKGAIYLRRGKLDRALEYLQQSLELSETLADKLQFAESNNFMGIICAMKGEFDQALNYHQMSLVMSEELGSKLEIGRSLNNIGIVYMQQGALDRALEYYEQCLPFYEEVGNRENIGGTLNNLGLIYQNKGNLKRALEYYQKALVQLKEGQISKYACGAVLNNMGEVYGLRGELNQAIKCYTEAFEIYEELDNKYGYCVVLGNLGVLFSQKGELNRASEYLERSLRIDEELGNNFTASESLLWLVSVAIDREAMEDAKEYWQRLCRIADQEKSKVIKQNCRLAEALVLKASSRIKDKAKAQETLQQLVEDGTANYMVTITAMLNLCELLLEELKAYGETSVLNEAKNLVDRLLSMATEQNSFSLAVNVILLQAKFALIEGDLISSTKLLEQARMTAERQDLVSLVDKARREQQLLEEQLMNWQQLIQSNAPLQERIKQATITEYLKEALKLARMRSDQ
ncbi:MAG: tetratricopeptide repeat protein [Candidatus Thorarchaeota archaeon]